MGEKLGGNFHFPCKGGKMNVRYGREPEKVRIRQNRDLLGCLTSFKVGFSDFLLLSADDNMCGFKFRWCKQVKKQFNHSSGDWKKLDFCFLFVIPMQSRVYKDCS